MIDHLIADRHVARRGCFDNVLCFMKKNSEEAHPYYVIRCQYKQLKKHKKWRMEIHENGVWRIINPNGVHRWNRFKRELIKKPGCCKKHFSLTKEKGELPETAIDVTI